jgi:hypothetical protein
MVCAIYKTLLENSVADPDPNQDPSDPYVFGPFESGSFGILKQGQSSGRALSRMGGRVGYRSKNCKKNLDSFCFVTSFLIFTFEKCTSKQ